MVQKFIRYNENRGVTPPISIQGIADNWGVIPYPESGVIRGIIDGAISEIFQSEYYAVIEGRVSPDETAQYFRNLFGGMTMELCQAIADCIANSSAVGDALNQYLTRNGYGGGAGAGETPLAYNNNPPVIDGAGFQDCDNANTFAAITQMIDLIHGVITDAFEEIELTSNVIERAALIFRAIPILGNLPIDEGLEELDNRVSALAESYAANYTLALRDTMRCELFCIAKDTCGLTFQQFADYFMAKIGQDIQEELFADSINWLLTGNYVGGLTVYASFALVANCLAYGASFFELDYNWLFRAVSAMLNDTDNDYLTLCDCGGGYCYSAVPSAATGYSLIKHGGTNNDIGAFVATGAGVTTNYDTFNTPHNAVAIRIAPPSIVNVTIITVTCDITQLGANDDAFLSVSGFTTKTGATVNALGVTEHVFTGNANLGAIDIRLELSTNNNPMTGAGVITSVKIEGIGINPFGANNC